MTGKTTMLRFGRATLALALLALTASAQAQIPTRYGVTLLETANSVSTSGLGYGPKINNSGWVNLYTKLYIPSGFAPYITARSLAIPPATYPAGQPNSDINNAKAISGPFQGGLGYPNNHTYYKGYSVYYPASGGSPEGFYTPLNYAGFDTTGLNGTIFGINQATECVGSVVYSTNPRTPGGNRSYGLYANPNNYTVGLLLPLYQAAYNLPQDVQANHVNAGKAVGYSYFTPPGATTNVRHACSWQTASAVYPTSSAPAYDFGTLLNNGTKSEAVRTNGNYIIGYSDYNGGGTLRATIFSSPTTNQDLGTLGGVSSCAYDINTRNTIVGWAATYTGVQHAFIVYLNNPTSPPGNTVIQTGKTLLDINDYVPGGNFAIATGINDNGQIVVVGDYNGVTGWYLLTPY